MKKILIVDDEESILLSLSHILQTNGVKVVTCNKIALAEEVLRSTCFDLVITDIQLSKAKCDEGLDLLKYVKDNYKTEVIVVTGYDTPDIEAMAYELGAMHYFSKPMDIHELLLKVDAIGIPTKIESLRMS